MPSRASPWNYRDASKPASRRCCRLSRPRSLPRRPECSASEQEEVVAAGVARAAAAAAAGAAAGRMARKTDGRAQTAGAPRTPRLSCDEDPTAFARCVTRAGSGTLDEAPCGGAVVSLFTPPHFTRAASVNNACAMQRTNEWTDGPNEWTKEWSNGPNSSYLFSAVHSTHQVALMKMYMFTSAEPCVDTSEHTCRVNEQTALPCGRWRVGR